MNTFVVLAMHGAPPDDFPRPELAEFFELHGRAEMSPAGLGPDGKRRYRELGDKIKAWPRTPQNDPFHAASHDLARALRDASGLKVVVGFNEFCAPDVDEAMAKAVAEGADRVIVLTTMMTRGGEHAEREIAQAVERGRAKHPGTEIVYAWPFETEEITRFLTGHLKKFFSDF